MIHRILFLASIWVAGASAFGTPQDLPNIRLFTGDYPRNVANEQELADYAEHFADLLARRADQAGEPHKELDLRILAANWILAYQIEPMASRMLLDMPEAQDAAAARAHLASALKHLERAGELLGALEENADDAESLRSRKIRAEYLNAFTQAFDAIWRDDYPDEAARDDALSDAASELSSVLEDDRVEVAAAAQLWQAFLYAQRNRVTRAVDLLPPAISDPEASRRYGLYARLLRCRLTADMVEGHAASVALLARMEERCLTWFGKEDRRRAAQRTAALFRRQVTHRWQDALRTAGETPRAEWCTRMISEIDRDYFPPPGPHEVLRLGRAVPAIVDLDEGVRNLDQPAEAAPAGATTRPAGNGSMQPASTQGLSEEDGQDAPQSDPEDE